MWKTFLMSCIMMLSVSGVALAHFGMVIPSAGTVTDKKDADVTLDLSFTHPMEMQGYAAGQGRKRCRSLPMARLKT